MDVWRLFSNNSYLSAILDRQGLMVAAPPDLTIKRAEGFSPQAQQSFGSKIKLKNPKIGVMCPTVFTECTNQTEVIWQQYQRCLAIAEYQILGGKHSSKSGKISWLKEIQYLQKKYHCQWTLLRGRQPKWILHSFGDLCNPLSLYRSRVSEWFQQNGKFVQLLEIVYRRRK